MSETPALSICLIHSQAMRYQEPSVPSPEMRIVGYAARELFKNKKADKFLLTVNTSIQGYKESDVSSAFLYSVGIPRDALLLSHVADTTDGEFLAFKKYIQSEAPDAAISSITIEAKKGRMALIAKRLKFYPHIYFAEDLTENSDDPAVVRETMEWRDSFRHTTMRIWLGIMPMAAMIIDPHSRIAAVVARAIRHQE